MFTSLIVSLPVFGKEQFWAFEHGFFPPLNHRFVSVSLFSDIMGHILAFNKPLIRGIEYPFKVLLVRQPKIDYSETYVFNRRLVLAGVFGNNSEFLFKLEKEHRVK